MSTVAPCSPSFRFTSGSESAVEPAHGYTSASGSEYATIGLGLGFGMRTKLGHGNSLDTPRAASLHAGLLCAPNSFTGPRVTAPPVSLTQSSPPAIRTSQVQLHQSSRPKGLPRDRLSPPLAAPSMHRGLLSRKLPLHLRLLCQGCRETTRDVPYPHLDRRSACSRGSIKFSPSDRILKALSAGRHTTHHLFTLPRPARIGCVHLHRIGGFPRHISVNIV
jgi:hypothetical protein